MKLLMKQLALALIYFAIAKLSLRLAYFHPSASPVWPPVGIALAGLLIWDVKLWPGVFVGAFFANLTTLGTVWTSLGIATGNALEAYFGAMLVNRYAEGKHAFVKPANIFRFAGLAGVISPLFSSLIGVTTLCLAGYAEWSHYANIWIIWWIGNMTSILTITPLFLLLSSPIRRRWPLSQYPEAISFIVSVLAVSWAIFYFPVDYLCVPLVVWAAFRFGERETAGTSVFFAVIAISGLIEGHGSKFQKTHYELLLFESFIAVVTLTGLLLASFVTDQLQREAQEREGTRKALRASEKRYQELFRVNIIGTMIIDWNGHVLDANDAFLSMLGYSRQELLDGQLGGPAMTPQEYHAVDEWTRERLLATGTCPTVEKEYFRKDGSRIPVLVGVVAHQEPEHQLVCLVIDASERRKAMDALRKAHDEMESRVTARTAELANMNRNLVREIDLRKRAEATLQTMAITDPMTGLYNRRGFKTLADQLLRQSRRARRPFIFYLADLDGLKRINDTYGHLEGDHAVNMAAAILRDTFRDSDVVARYGGDEFAIATVEDESEVGPRPYLQRLQEKLADYNHASNKEYVLNLSVGIATVMPGVSRPIERIIEEADKELYEQKRSKKLKVV